MNLLIPGIKLTLQQPQPSGALCGQSEENSKMFKRRS